MEETGPQAKLEKKPWASGGPFYKLPPQVQEEGRKDQKETQCGSSAWLSYLAGPGAVHREGQGAGRRGAASVEERATG